MKDNPHTLPAPVIYGFFLLGILSAISFRVIIVIGHIDPTWVRPVWYAGVVGYMIFFLYRYSISKKRKRAIEDFALIDKVRSGEPLSDEDREVVVYLLSSIKKSLEDVNYCIIFLLSILAIAVDLVLNRYTIQ
jgi:hypothetical protein